AGQDLEMFLFGPAPGTPLHDAVLEWLKADDRHSAAWFEHAQRRIQAGLQRAEVVVDRDAQRLEGARRGVNATARRPKRSRDRRQQLACPIEWPLHATLDNRPSQASSPRFLAVLSQRP